MPSLLPNYRGNTGWGQPIRKLNIGDPAAPSSTTSWRASTIASPQGIADPDRLGVTGASYGGYMTAWAVADDRPLQGRGDGLRHLQPVELPLQLQP